MGGGKGEWKSGYGSSPWQFCGVAACESIGVFATPVTPVCRCISTLLHTGHAQPRSICGVLLVDSMPLTNNLCALLHKTAGRTSHSDTLVLDS